MANLSHIIDSTFHYFPHNETYATPGFYNISIGDASWILSSTLIIFGLQTGFALFESGTVTTKNEVNIMMKVVCDVCFGGLSYWLFGYGLMYGRGQYTNPFFGLGDFIVDAKVQDPLMGHIFTTYFFQLSFSTTATTIVSGAVAERFRFHAYILFSFVNTIVYSIGAGWIWGEHGFLRNLGAVDFAGSGPIHIIGGSAALTAILFIGPRLHRYDNGTKSLPMGNPMNACVGFFFLWWSWLAFNSGSSFGLTGGKWQYAARAGVGTALSSMGGGVFSIMFSMYRNKGKVDVFEVMSGILASLVSINAGCCLFPSYISVLVGILASYFALLAIPLFDNLRLDDPIGALSVHLIGGIWGQLAVGLFAQNPLPLTLTNGREGLLIGGGWYLLGVQCFSIICLTLWGALITYPILWSINKFIRIRMDPQDEILGADLVEHYMGDDIDKMIAKVLDKIKKEHHVPIDPKIVQVLESFSQHNSNENRKRFQNNFAFEHDEGNSQQHQQQHQQQQKHST